MRCCPERAAAIALLVAAVCLPAGPAVAAGAPAESGVISRLALDEHTQAIGHAKAEAVGRHRSFISTWTVHGTRRPMVVAPARTKAYSLPELRRNHPAAFRRQAGALIVNYPVMVAPGATLVVDSRTTPRVRLASGSGTGATLAAIGSRLVLRGHPGRPLDLGSLDPASDTMSADESETDGRAFVYTRGGHLVVTHARLHHLGYPSGVGITSGVAWVGDTATIRRRATGRAVHAVFANNHFGGYTAWARGLAVRHSQFRDNTRYGFDPHTFTRRIRVTDSTAVGNGSHGFILSAGCERNVLRRVVSGGNGGSGFMIDDGRTSDGGTAPSNHNRLIRISASANAREGVVIEGGTGNAVRHARLDHNRYGVWLRGQAEATRVRDTTITDTAHTALRLGAATSDTVIADSSVQNAGLGLVAEGAASARLRRLTIATAQVAALRLSPEAEVTGLDTVSIRDLRHPPPGPLRWVSRGGAVLWGLLIVVPACLVVVNRRRRSVRSGTAGSPAPGD